MNENQALENAKCVALRKRIFVWFFSNFIAFELFCFLWFSVNNFNSLRYLDAVQNSFSVVLFTAFIFYTKQSFEMTKGNFGSTSLRVRPFTMCILILLANLLFACLVGRTVYVIVISTSHKTSSDLLQFNTISWKTDLVPIVSAFIALFTTQRNEVVLSEFDATRFHHSYIQCLKSKSARALKHAAVVASIATLLSAFCKVLLTVYLTYACTSVNATQFQMCPNISYVESLLPVGGMWITFYLSFMTVFLVHVLVSILHDSLCLVEYFPVDFTKLISSISAKRVASIVSEGEDRRDYADEKPLLASLAKGLVLPSFSPLYPWLSQQTLSTQTSSSGLTSIGGISSHLGGQKFESHIPCDRQGRPLYTAQDPNWRIALKIQQHNADLLVQTADYNVLDPPCLPFWGEVPNRVQTALAVAASRGTSTARDAAVDPSDNILSNEDLLFRSFALQDLRRVASSSFLRRQMVFKKHWAEVVFILSSLIDATALQLHFVDTYINEGVPVDASRVALLAHYDETAEAQATSDSMDVDQTLLHSLSTSTDSNGIKRPFSAATELTQFGANITDLAKRVQSGHLGGSVVNQTISTQYSAWTSRTFYLQGVRSFREVLGLSIKDRSSALHRNMFPPVMAQSAVNGIDSISLLLVAALSEDSSGLAQHHVPSVVNSLLTLEHALRAYSDTLHQTYFSNFNKLGRVQRIQYRVRSIAHLPQSMQLLSIATDEALNRLVGAYRDILTSCVFVDPLHAKAFQSRLENHSPSSVGEIK